MAGNAVKSIVLLMVLVVLSAIIGSQFSSDLSQSYGAFYVIVGVVTLFGLLILGEKCWWLVYILPAMLQGLPFYRESPVAFALTNGLLVCCALMWCLGHVKFSWHSAPLLDLPVLVLFGFFLVSYIRFPVSLNALGLDVDYVGGKEYVWCVCAMLHYVAISTLTPHSAPVPKVLKWSMLLLLMMQIPYCLKEFVSRSALSEEFGVGARYSMYYYAGSTLIYFTYSKYPFSKIVGSLKSLSILVVGLVLLMFTGGRESMLRAASATAFLAFLKKELTVAVLIGGVLYAFAFLMGAQHMWEEAPYSVQRVLTMLPGVEVSRAAAHETSGSSETRRIIWSLGLDPHSGLIRDYVWGDGFQLSTAVMRRAAVAEMRGTTLAKTAANKDFAWAYQLASGNSWHNGWLTAIKRIGLMGLASVNLMFICGLIGLVKVSNAYRGIAEYPYLISMCLPFASIALTFVIGTQTFIQVFETLLPLGYIKLLYCLAREQGKIRPLFVRSAYVPLVIREQTTETAR